MERGLGRGARMAGSRAPPPRDPGACSCVLARAVVIGQYAGAPAGTKTVLGSVWRSAPGDGRSQGRAFPARSPELESFGIPAELWRSRLGLLRKMVLPARNLATRPISRRSLRARPDRGPLRHPQKRAGSADVRRNPSLGRPVSAEIPDDPRSAGFPAPSSGALSRALSISLPRSLPLPIPVFPSPPPARRSPPVASACLSTPSLPSPQSPSVSLLCLRSPSFPSFRPPFLLYLRLHILRSLCLPSFNTEFCM